MFGISTCSGHTSEASCTPLYSTPGPSDGIFRPLPITYLYLHLGVWLCYSLSIQSRDRIIRLSLVLFHFCRAGIAGKLAL